MLPQQVLDGPGSYLSHPAVTALMGVIAGFILTTFVLQTWRKSGELTARLWRFTADAFALRDFEKAYCDWVVTDLCHLRG